MRIAISTAKHRFAPPIEMVERKGIGHPDTICDAVAESVSNALSNYYIAHFGGILHHNVDKALLVGGVSEPAFGGGRVLVPMELILAGRATASFQGHSIPVTELAIETAKSWLREYMPTVDLAHHIQISSKIRPGSGDLTELFGRNRWPLCNDTSIGVGYFPLSDCEALTLEMEQYLHAPDTKRVFPFIGSDSKVMGVRENGCLTFTVAIAMIDRYIADLQDYAVKKNQVGASLCGRFGLAQSSVVVNAADDLDRGSIYLTVTGTSAESGDDGQVGRGNRYNGLITPYRPMTMEAYAGKNPVSHVGKTYTFFAQQLSEALVTSGFARAAQVILVSKIGNPVQEPQLVDICLEETSVGEPIIQEYVQDKLETLPEIWKQILKARYLS